MRAEPDSRWSPVHPAERPRRRGWSLVRRILLVLFLVTVVPVALYRLVAPPVTPLMLIRYVSDGAPVRKTWVPLSRISPALVRAVVASEDEKFCVHHGFDWVQMQEAWHQFMVGHRRPRGASTISMQTAKNVFLWPGRSLLRKAIEAYFTVLIETLWGKPRIMEVYLNVIEWGRGIYGAEAAARTYFGHGAATLSPREAAVLAAVLPNPRKLSAVSPGAYVEGRAATIRARMPFMMVPTARGCP
ncbi:MAG TPA: monofunctional biosynthetic peptidoglycan transglycosylase [Alphaproteobacteria bacterium]|nr:monofunctional biosynthetic peptidoglycan transglycosylase [Alphaproteobacteria bacterium]